MINLLYLGNVGSQDQLSYYIKNSKNGYQFAAQNLQESIIEGFLANDCNINVLSVPYLSTYPKGYKKAFVPSCDFVISGKTLGRSIGYLNLPFVNKPTMRTIIKHIRRWYDNATGIKAIFVYSLSPYFMRIALEAKKLYPDIIISIIVPDLPRFMGHNKYVEMLGLYEKEEAYIYSSIKKFDRIVVLAKPMLDDLGVTNIPSIVMEGIFSGHVNETVTAKSTDEKIILYTGNIDERYGIVELLDAFALLPDPTYRLYIRGNGSTFKSVMERAEKDKRIKYIEPLSRAELIELQRKASLLVNPVSESQEFTQYFFPSKTMDYLASATPVLMYKLKCMPSEYSDVLYYAEGKGATALAKSIESILSHSYKDAIARGQAAARFIKDKKNPKVQTKLIIDLIQNYE